MFLFRKANSYLPYPSLSHYHFLHCSTFDCDFPYLIIAKELLKFSFCRNLNLNNCSDQSRQLSLR